MNITYAVFGFMCYQNNRSKYISENLVSIICCIPFFKITIGRKKIITQY